MSDTPRTDAAICDTKGYERVKPEFARQLERELADAIAQRDELLKTADAWFEAWNSGHEMDWKEAKEMEKLIIKLKGESHE